jgi:hypothetical protein
VSITDESSEKQLFASNASSLELADPTKNREDDERDEPDRNNATGFNILASNK